MQSFPFYGDPEDLLHTPHSLGYRWWRCCCREYEGWFRCCCREYQGWFRDAHNIQSWAYQYKPSKAVTLTQRDFASQVLRDSGPWLVDFYTTWCGHCQQFAPTFEAIAEVRVAVCECMIS